MLLSKLSPPLVPCHLAKKRRAADGFGEDGSQGFRLKAYLPLSLAVYTLGVAAEQLPAFTAGSRTGASEGAAWY